MKKLSLNLDELAVESFATADPAGVRGTVQGHDETTGPQIVCSCNPSPRPTDYLSCYGTCDSACFGSCDATCGGDSCDYCPTGDYRCGDTLPGQIVCA